MYIIELFFKIKKDLELKKYKKNKQQQQLLENENEKCNHLFVPIDSSGRILACSKCGEIYKLQKGGNESF